MDLEDSCRSLPTEIFCFSQCHPIAPRDACGIQLQDCAHKCLGKPMATLNRILSHTCKIQTLCAGSVLRKSPRVVKGNNILTLPLALLVPFAQPRWEQRFLTVSYMKRKAAASCYNLTSLLFFSITKIVILRLAFNGDSVTDIK